MKEVTTVFIKSLKSNRHQHLNFLANNQNNTYDKTINTGVSE